MYNFAFLFFFEFAMIVEKLLTFTMNSRPVHRHGSHTS